MLDSVQGLAVVALMAVGLWGCAASKPMAPTARATPAVLVGHDHVTPPAVMEPHAVIEAAPVVAPEPANAPAPAISVVPPVVTKVPAPAEPAPVCPPEMVFVDGRVCVDRYEATLVDARSGQPLSPYYPPSRKLALATQRRWKAAPAPEGEAAAIAMPTLPAIEQKDDVEPKAIVKKGAVPQGYTSGALAAEACKNAGKRLCTLDEWRTACRGAKGQAFPYGEHYQQGKCNVFREAHPAQILHGKASEGHSDPRLNLVTVNGKPLLRTTGATSTCMSEWGQDGVADMVGNVDEWVDDPDGTFVGGFYSRSKRDGCQSIVRTHPYDYWDYSTGIRCCADPATH